MMTMDEFEILLARHGADERNWPPAVCGAAQTLLQASAAARALLDDARAVDEALRGLPPVQAPATLKADILARVNAEIVRHVAPPVAPQIALLSYWRRFWPQATGFVAASVLGFVLGVANVGPLANDGVDVSAYVLGFDGDAVTISMNEEPE